MQEFSKNPSQDTKLVKNYTNQDNQIIPALYVVSTPIGNLGDITLRAIKTLEKCDAIICEDTRVTSRLLASLDIKKPLMVYNDQSDNIAREKILNQILQGKSLSLVSDAGTPLISDPGYKLVDFLLENNCQVLSVPGACSLVAALSVSGIASNRFMFVGFVPSTLQARENLFKELVSINSSLIFFETSNRLILSLKSMLRIFGNRIGAVCREISKIYEQTKKDTLENLIAFYQQNPPKGEIVILISPKNKGEIDFTKIDQELKQNLGKLKPKELVEMIANNFLINKKLVYQRMLQVIKDKSDNKNT